MDRETWIGRQGYGDRERDWDRETGIWRQGEVDRDRETGIGRQGHRDRDRVTGVGDIERETDRNEEGE